MSLSLVKEVQVIYDLIGRAKQHLDTHAPELSVEAYHSTGENGEQCWDFEDLASHDTIRFELGYRQVHVETWRGSGDRSLSGSATLDFNWEPSVLVNVMLRLLVTHLCPQTLPPEATAALQPPVEEADPPRWTAPPPLPEGATWVLPADH